jgi:hypothetical protein
VTLSHLVVGLAAVLVIGTFVTVWVVTTSLNQRRARDTILALLTDVDRELYGHEIVASVAVLSRASVYVLLDRMEDDWLIESRSDPRNPAGWRDITRMAYGLPPARLYRLKGAPCSK